jgi:hypothetical protein
LVSVTSALPSSLEGSTQVGAMIEFRALGSLGLAATDGRTLDAAPGSTPPRLKPHGEP